MTRTEQVLKMLEADPDDVFLNFALAMEYVNQDRLAEAVAQFDRVIDVDSTYIVAYVQQGSALVKMGRHDDAKAALAKGLTAAQQAGDNHAADDIKQKIMMLG